MKKILIIILTLNCIICLGQDNSIKEPYIEVIGTATKEVIPDKIFIEITLSEKLVNRKKYTIVEQENKLISSLKTLNIDLNNLSLSDSNSIITRNKRRETGVKLTKEYILIVSNSEQVSSVFNMLFNINIKEASIIKTESTKIIEIRKQVRISAIQVAKEKATYLLEAIGEEVGKPLQINEIQKSYNTNTFNQNLRPNATFATPKYDYKLNQIAFETIEVKYSYYIKYSIK